MRWLRYLGLLFFAVAFWGTLDMLRTAHHDGIFSAYTFWGMTAWTDAWLFQALLHRRRL